MNWRRDADPLLTGAVVHPPGQGVKSLSHATAYQYIRNRLTSCCCPLPCVDNIVVKVGP